MTPERRDNLLLVLAQIQEDLEQDVAKHDGQEITGHRLAVMHAELSAVVAGLAAVVTKMLEES